MKFREKKLVRVLAIVLMLAMLTGCLAGCGGVSVEDANEKLIAYINENGNQVSDEVCGVICETSIDCFTLLLIVRGDELILGGEYNSSGGVMSYNTNIYLNDENRGEVKQVNTVSAGSYKVQSQFEGATDLATYTADTEIEGGEFKSSVGTGERTDAFMDTVYDGINTTLEMFAEFLADSELELTLADFGFEAYTIDAERESTIREDGFSDVKENDPPAPVPISVKIQELGHNSIGTPEIALKITNTGDKDIVACNVAVLCYDAYGEQLTQYNGSNGGANLAYHEVIKAGETTSAVTWTLNGFDTVKTVKVAVLKYQLEGEDAVTIATKLNDENLVWFEQS